MIHGDRVVPFKPVTVGDHFGLSSAVYLVNNLKNNCGESRTTMREAKNRISKLVSKAKISALTLLLQEWYSEDINEDDAREIIDTLPDQIENDDIGRYSNHSVVNDIEWSALATMYNCCIAVKYIKKRNEGSISRLNPGWKIAVPVPRVFGVEGIDTAGKSARCVFMICHTSLTMNTYVALLPHDENVFPPGRLLLQKKNETEELAPEITRKFEGDAIPASVHFEGYVLEDKMKTESEKKLFNFNFQAPELQKEKIQCENGEQTPDKVIRTTGLKEETEESDSETCSCSTEDQKYEVDTRLQEGECKISGVVASEESIIGEESTVKVQQLEFYKKNINESYKSTFYADGNDSGKPGNRVASVRNGRIEIEVGELSEATVLFNRAYGDSEKGKIIKNTVFRTFDKIMKIEGNRSAVAVGN